MTSSHFCTPTLKASLEGSPIPSSITSSEVWDTPSSDSDQPSWDTGDQGRLRDSFKFLCLCLAALPGMWDHRPQTRDRTPHPLHWKH